MKFIHCADLHLDSALDSMLAKDRQENDGASFLIPSSVLPKGQEKNRLLPF